MKMSQAMGFLGYPEDLIQKQEAREVTTSQRPNKRRPCQTCKLDTGYGWNGHIWCVNTKCDDFHTVFTAEEWQEDRAVVEARRAHEADL